nr:hypothetical protein [Kibdelosporangium sp. MJ126-NF4]CTQ91168.1 hypothetical protein [Kibdelosporangium sp. MJ126-NF4]
MREAIDEFVVGLRQGSGSPTDPWASCVDGGPLAELRTGVGEEP